MEEQLLAEINELKSIIGQLRNDIVALHVEIDTLKRTGWPSQPYGPVNPNPNIPAWPYPWPGITCKAYDPDNQPYGMVD